jgi:hypothetical protein
VNIIKLEGYITKIIAFIAFVDYSTNNEYYKRTTPQIIDLLKFLHDKYVNNIYDVIYKPIDTGKLNHIINRIIELRILHKPSRYISDKGMFNPSVFSYNIHNMLSRK